MEFAPILPAFSFSLFHGAIPMNTIFYYIIRAPSIPRFHCQIGPQAVRRMESQILPGEIPLTAASMESVIVPDIFVAAFYLYHHTRNDELTRAKGHRKYLPKLR